MSKEAVRAERDLNSQQAKQGTGTKSVSAEESGVDANVERKFPTAEVRYGGASESSGSDNRPIPEDEGGQRDDRGRVSRAKHFKGQGGPEDKARIETEKRPGDDDTWT